MKYNIEAPKQASPNCAGGAQVALPNEEVWRCGSARRGAIYTEREREMEIRYI